MSRNTEVKAVHGNIVVKLDSIDNLKGSVLINNEEIHISAVTSLLTTFTILLY